jgi:mediator of RNA polymerase II transcription subunit 5
MDSMVKEWALFLDRSLEFRLPADTFNAAAAQLYARSPLPGHKLANLLLKPRSAAATTVDPRVVVYLERLLALKRLDASDVLSSTFHYSNARLPRTGDADSSATMRWSNPSELEEIVCHRLHKAFAAEERPVNNAEGIRALIIVTRWMQAMVTSHTSDTMIQAMAGIQQQPQQQSVNVREGLGMLVVGLIENTRILHMLNSPNAKGRWLMPVLDKDIRASLKEQSSMANMAQILGRTLPHLCHLSFHSYPTTL